MIKNMSYDSQVGKIAKCGKCGNEKRIVHDFMDGRSVKGLICEDCLMERCFCDICNAETNYSSYEKHLLSNHKIEDLLGI